MDKEDGLGNRHYDPATYSNAFSTNQHEPMNSDCSKCRNPNLKGTHTCGADELPQHSGWQQVMPSTLPYPNKSSNTGEPLVGSTTSPIKVFTVCVDPGIGRYMAFLGSNPEKKATGDSRSEAITMLLIQNKLIVMTEID